MKIALVYDWLTTQYGGAEQVLLALHEIFPEAPLYTSIYNPRQAAWAKKFKVRTSWLQKIPFVSANHRLVGLLLPLAFESFNFDEFDLIISVTSFAAKGILTKPGQRHICYLLTPPRYLYSHQAEYLAKWQKIPLLGRLVKLTLKYLIWWDQVAASRPDQIVPISNLVAGRVKKYYHRSTELVIYPPVNIEKSTTEKFVICNSKSETPYYLVISRLVHYKRLDLAIQACRQLGRNLIIIGEGPEKKALQKIADQSSKLDIRNSMIMFLGSLSNSQLQNLYNGCTALLMPGEEDFGITGLEALACGKPVVVYHQSGVAEIIKNNLHGIHFEEQTISSLMRAMIKLESTRFVKSQLMNQAQQFSTTQFQHHFQQFIKLPTK